MMDEREIIDVLKQIRDEAKQTNVRIEDLSNRLNARVDKLSDRLESYVDRLDVVTRRQSDSELRLGTEVASLADVTRHVRDLSASE